MQNKLRASDHDIQVCTVNYRPPDVTLGSQRFEEDFDMWSFGCVAAELYSHQMLFAPAATAEQAPSGKDFVDAIAAMVGRPRDTRYDIDDDDSEEDEEPAAPAPKKRRVIEDLEDDV